MKGAMLAALALAGAAACLAGEPTAPLTDGEIWNEGVDCYRAGDVTNALRVLRPLVLSRTHGARAAEVVAALCGERAKEVDADEALKLLEESATAAQIALRAAPGDAKANRNFTRAVARLPELRERRHVEEVLKAAQGKDPGAMLQGATASARRLMDEAAGFRTNAPERAVALADSLSAEARRLADVWLPVRELIVQSVTNREQAATILTQVENARAMTRKAAGEFGDLDAEAYASMSGVEHDFTRFLKLTILPPGAMAEDLVAQSNAWQDVAAFNGRSWQQDALDYTRAFRAKFPAWAQAYEQQAQADTNRPPFTAEDQAKVSALATELEKLQLECCRTVLPPKQEEAVALINQIRELLPKDPNGGSSGQQQQQQQQQQQNQQGQQKQDQQQQQQQDQGQDSEPPQDRPPEDGQKDERQAEENSGDEKSDEEKDVEAILKKAQERNDEHEAEKRARMRKAPLPPNERDW